MLDRDLIRRNPEIVRAGISRKRLDAPVDEFLKVDSDWRAERAALETKQAELNAASKSIGALMAQRKVEEANAAKAAAKALSEAIPAHAERARELEAQLTELELAFPNLPHESVPDGEDESANVTLRTWGEKPDNEAPPHWEIAERLGLLDLPRGAKVTGSGFPIYVGAGARLQRALASLMLDIQIDRNGYAELYPPFIVNRASLIGTGNLPKFEEDLYKIDDDHYLIPTAEVPITNYYRDEILDGADLPLRYAGFTACFRREAGAAGKDTRGIQRIHQFDKVELVWFTTPDKSYEHLEVLTAHAESVLQALGMHYRVIEICAGDLGAKGAKQYDVELWSPGMSKYLEISSCSNFEAYQSRRANIRYRPEPGARPEFVHILNGSGLALPRLYAALLETGLRPDGNIGIPDALQPYMKCDVIGDPRATGN
ncbi:MAG TPA: serine--tRNA ligase [Fimbriimonadaceae bacterium]|nr:serine--tRNA ligase [Fimbriimonadaceae bacterium]